MTLEKANRGVEPEAQKAKRQLSAIVDYNRDGFMETARLSYNGKQMAVVIDFEHPRKHQMVVYKSHLVSDVEIYGAGSRILMNWPDLGYKILLLHRNKPSVVSIGD